MITTSTSHQTEERFAEAYLHSTIREQTRSFLRLVLNYKFNIALLKEKLQQLILSKSCKINKEAIKLALNHIDNKKDQFELPVREAINEILMKENVFSSTSNNSHSHQASPISLIFNSQSFSEGEEICHYIANSISNLMLGKNSLKLRLHKGENNNIKLIPLLSDNYHLVENSQELSVKEAKGFASLFATLILIADTNIEQTNCCLRQANNNIFYWTRITGNPLFYKSLPEVTIIYKNIRKLFPQADSSGLNFICELNQFINNIDEKKIRKAISAAFNDISETFGSSFIERDGVSKALTSRLNISKDETLNMHSIEEHIISNIKKLCKQLNKMLEEDFTNILKQNKNPNETRSILYKKLLDTLDKVNQAPTNLNLFMKDAINNDDFKAVQYLYELNRQNCNEDIKINGSSPLEFALDQEKNQLALNMLKEGFSLNSNDSNKSEKDQKNREIALKNILERNIGQPKLRKTV
ncbi:MAG: hypothetical protein WBJ81_02025 [Rickettsiales bacterium]